MVNTPSIAALIRDNKTFRISSDIQTGAKYGMVTLDSFLIDKYMAGMIAREEVITKAQDPLPSSRSSRNWNWPRPWADPAEAAGSRQKITQLCMSKRFNPLLALIKEQGLIDDLQYRGGRCRNKRSGKPVGPDPPGLRASWIWIPSCRSMAESSGHRGGHRWRTRRFSPEVLKTDSRQATARMYQCMPVEHAWRHGASGPGRSAQSGAHG